MNIVSLHLGKGGSQTAVDRQLKSVLCFSRSPAVAVGNTLLTVGRAIVARLP